MRWLPTFFLLFITLACSHTPPALREPQSHSTLESLREKTLSNLRSQAHLFYKRGDYLRCIPFYELMLQFGETSLGAEDRFVLGYSYLSVGENEKAEEFLRSGIRLLPYRSVGYQLLGLVFLAQGKPGLASEHFRKGVEFDSHPPKIHFYLGLAYERLGKGTERDREFQKAEEEYEKVLLQNIYDFGANFELAYLYLTLGHKITKVGELVEHARIGLKESDPELVEGGTLYNQFYLPLLEGMEAFRKNETEKAGLLLQQAALASPQGAKIDFAEVLSYLAANEKGAGREGVSLSFWEMRKTFDPYSSMPRF